MISRDTPCTHYCGLGFGSFALCIFVSLLYLLIELPSFLLICERETRHTLLQLKCMEECSIVTIFEAFIKLLIPKNASVSHYVHNLEEESIPNEVFCEYNRPGYSRELPFFRIWVCNIKSADRDCNDVVRRAWNGPFDNLFFVFTEYRRHVISVWYFARFDVGNGRWNEGVYPVEYGFDFWLA